LTTCARFCSQNVLRDLLATLKQEFDIVLIDSPPVLQIPDARVLGRMVDGVIRLVRAGHTTREVAHGALRSLIDVRCRVLGTVLNYWIRIDFQSELMERITDSECAFRMAITWTACPD
jgi:Mrp family chromosome partitioning ATPase